VTYLVIGAVLFAIGIRLGYWFGRDDGYHLACHEIRVEAAMGNPKYQDIIRAAKQSAERN
jgi:hypothetical protein